MEVVKILIILSLVSKQLSKSQLFVNTLLIHFWISLIKFALTKK